LPTSVTVEAAQDPTFCRPSRFFRLAVLVCLLTAAPTGSVQTLTGAQALRAIDWNTVKTGDPIPASMPTSFSDDPVEAGFAPQWIQRALAPDPASCSSGDNGNAPDTACARTLAWVIASKHRSEDDRWSYEFERELRHLIHNRSAERPTISRVFCNSVGCLCYVERSGRPSDPPPLDQQIIYHELLGEPGRRFGIGVKDLNLVRSDPYDHHFAWELTLVRRPTHLGAFRAKSTAAPSP
jgi:hypothetical protein